MSACLVFAVFAAATAGSPATAPLDEAIAKKRMENSLRSTEALHEQNERWHITSRMQHWKVPGVSIAVMDKGRIAWSAAWGVADVRSGTPLTPLTPMQAASVSKPVAAAAAMTLVADGTLQLDTDVNQTLQHWKVPASSFTQDQPITLRHLLSHTAGLTVSGFNGYLPDAPLPTLNQILDGQVPANSPAVVSQAVPGTGVSYSGGGYQLVQRLLEDATGKDFQAVLHTQVFVPAGMDNSGYGVPPAHAVGHDANGETVDGGWRAHPELAAAGLWTTPRDLAKFSLALTASHRGTPDGLLPGPMADAMFTPVFGFAGLGPAINGTGERMYLSHAGQNEGFRSYWLVYPARGDGVVVMSNGEGSFQLIGEIIQAVADTHGWSDYVPAQ